jgi:hypothetical protein
VRQCLKRSLPDIETLEQEVDVWCTERNRPGAGVEWRFTAEDARIKLRILYAKTRKRQWPSDLLPDCSPSTLSTCLIHPSVGVIERNRSLVSLLLTTGAPSRVLAGWQ